MNGWIEREKAFDHFSLLKKEVVKTLTVLLSLSLFSSLS